MATDLKEVKKRPGGEKIEAEPNWKRAEVLKNRKKRLYPLDEAGVGPDDKPLPIMQTDMLKPFYLDIGNYGLNYAFHKLKIAAEEGNLTADEVDEQAKKYQYTKTKNKKTVIIVGAGISGLVAAYELKKAGHEVKIFEAQHRVGGRVRTYAEEYFYTGQWSDAGAMRIPGTGQIGGVSKHFLTDFYSEVQFQLPVQNFANQVENGFDFYGGKKVSRKDWNKDPTKYCDEVWPHWHDGLTKEKSKKYKIVDIDSYYNATIKPVLNNIIQASKGRPTADDWYAWLKRWSLFSVGSFLFGSFDEIKAKLTTYDKMHPEKQPKMWSEEMDSKLAPLKDLLPWSLDAVAAFTARIYSPGIDISLSELLRDELGQWWKDPMHTFKGGMQSLPNAFMKDTPNDNSPDQHLAKDIQFGAVVYKVSYNSDGVCVFFKNNSALSTRDHSATEAGIAKGDAVIITLPLHIIRQVTFDPPLHTSITNSISNVNYGPSTKIMLQCKEKFWQQGDDPINGGFSFTDLPISQLHYPTRLPDSDPKDRGVLMVYTWKQEALMFGSVPPDAAIQIALDEIEKIHPEIREYYEVGGVKAWYDDPYAQGAFCMLQPRQISGVMRVLLYPTTNKKNPKDMIPQIYFAGEAISYCNGWIQGALESGVRSAYQFYARNELKISS